MKIPQDEYFGFGVEVLRCIGRDDLMQNTNVYSSSS
jgi:hypothetical protein